MLGDVVNVGVPRDGYVVLAPQRGHERQRPELLFLHDDRFVAAVIAGRAQILLVVVAPVPRRLLMMLYVVVEPKIAVLGVDEVDRVAVDLMRVIGIDEAMLIKRDQRDERAAEKTRDEEI